MTSTGPLAQIMAVAVALTAMQSMADDSADPAVRAASMYWLASQVAKPSECWQELGDEVLAQPGEVLFS